MVKENGCDEVNALNITEFRIVDAIGEQYFFEHYSEFVVFAEGGIVWVGAVNVFVDLCFVGGSGREFAEFGVSEFVFGTDLLAPLRAILARTLADAPAG